MTVIFGVNLQDCVYLAADTRVTYLDGKPCEDNFTKYHPINPYITCIAAGHAHFASYILNRIDNSYLKTASYNDFINNIDDFIKTDQDLGIYKFINRLPKVCFIFGGVDKTKNKSISERRLKMMQSLSNPNEHCLDGSYVNGTYKKNLFGTDREIISKYIAFSTISSLQINWVDNKIIINKKNANWGEFLIHGEKQELYQDNIDLNFLKTLDSIKKPKTYYDSKIKTKLIFERRKNQRKNIQEDTLMITHYILNYLIPKYNLKSVGGAITVLRLDGAGLMFDPYNMITIDLINKSKIQKANLVTKKGQMHIKFGNKLVKCKKLIDVYKKQKEETDYLL